MDILRFKGKGTEITHVDRPDCLIDTQSQRVFLKGKYTEQAKTGRGKDSRLVDVEMELHLTREEAEAISNQLDRMVGNARKLGLEPPREPGQEG